METALSAAPPPSNEPPRPEQPIAPNRLRDALRIAAKGMVLLIGAMALMIAIVALVPDGNDYALATRGKNARLHASVPRKIVLVGGSNIAYGLDSAVIQRELGGQVVNMGMNGYLGVRFMLEEVKAAVKPPDVVVIALEYDSFYKSVDGTSRDLLMIAKANPAAFEHLSWSQRLGVLGAVPYVAQQKLIRILRDAVRLSPKKTKLIDKVESAAGFNEYGDLTSHLGVKWPNEREDGIDLTRTPMDGEVIGLLQDFARRMNARGVPVIVSYTSAIQTYYDRHKQSIDSLHVLLTQSPPLIVPSPPTAFVYPEPWFFDTVYHLNAEGRAARTQKLVADLKERVR